MFRFSINVESSEFAYTLHVQKRKVSRMFSCFDLIEWYDLTDGTKSNFVPYLKEVLSTGVRNQEFWIEYFRKE